MRREALKWTIVFALMGVGNSVGAFLRQVCFSMITERMVMRVRKSAFTAIIRQHIGWFDSSVEHTVSVLHARGIGEPSILSMH